MPSYQITTDKGTYQVDTESPDSGTTNVTNDLNTASSALDSLVSPKAQEQQSPQQPAMSPIDKGIQVAGQFGKAVYSNPLAHPALKLLSDLTGSNANQAYGNLPAPQGVMENVAAGAGAAVPLILASTPIGRGVDLALDGIASGTSTVPILGKLTGFLQDSTIAKAAITGYGYGAAEATAMNAQGQAVDVNSYAKDTAGQFALWGALTRGGATLGAKFLPKDLPMAQKIVASMPQALKTAYTPEGLGSIAGGMIAGAMNAPDQQKGLAGAILGGAMSAMSPSEQFQFKQGIGKGVGMNGVSTITDHWGKNFQEANNIIEKYGFNDVEQAANATIDKPNEFGTTEKLDVPQQVFDNHKQAIGEIKQGLSSQYEQALMKNEDITPKNMDSFLSLLRQRVSSIQDPQSPVSKVFNRLYDTLTGMQSDYLVQEEISKRIKNGDIEVSKNSSPLDIYRSLPQNIREGILKNIQAKNNNSRGMSEITLNGLHQLKIKMQDMVDPSAYVEKRPFTSEEREANGIAKMISNFIGKQNEAYATVNQEYSKMKDIENKVYYLDSTKLSQNKLSFNDTQRNIRDSQLDDISNYLKSRGKGNYDSRRLLNKYYAYQTYNNPSEAGLAKNYPVRAVVSGLLGGGAQALGIPGGFLLGGLAGWHLGNPQAWLPILKGASQSPVMNASRKVATK